MGGEAEAAASGKVRRRLLWWLIPATLAAAVGVIVWSALSDGSATTPVAEAHDAVTPRPAEPDADPLDCDPGDGGLSRIVLEHDGTASGS